jgi:hypothetical protein
MRANRQNGGDRHQRACQGHNRQFAETGAQGYDPMSAEEQPDHLSAQRRGPSGRSRRHMGMAWGTKPPEAASPLVLYAAGR